MHCHMHLKQSSEILLHSFYLQERILNNLFLTYPINHILLPLGLFLSFKSFDYYSTKLSFTILSIKYLKNHSHSVTIIQLTDEG